MDEAALTGMTLTAPPPTLERTRKRARPRPTNCQRSEPALMLTGTVASEGDSSAAVRTFGV